MHRERPRKIPIYVLISSLLNNKVIFLCTNALYCNEKLTPAKNMKIVVIHVIADEL